ncbi:mitochondrial assembly of ribosomal large subunit protein 1 [Hemicordylus capensis]|uniref:mitochondrial assembly of ribosomal large subunit protein 1 n=1 Tax=Hemicordylus capensis TaxID=884348 RepID=UPI002302B3F7|nr:mitochondrial assembly of ribosomal large subunit protein 1 [Hemicordylus capensis]
MWRGSRCLRALLPGLQSRGVVPESTKWVRGPRAPVHLATPIASPAGPSWVSSLGLRRASGVGSSELWDATEEVAEVEREEVHQPEQRSREGLASSTFNLDYVVSLLRQENAKDICVIQLPPEMRYSNYFVIVSGSSTRHLHAMVHYLVKMYKHLKRDCDPHILIEGKDCDDWLCIDFGNIVIHFMLPETREIYELERLWTLRSYDDQLAQILPESLPEDFIFGLTCESKD